MEGRGEVGSGGEAVFPLIGSITEKVYDGYKWKYTTHWMGKASLHFSGYCVMLINSI